MNISLPWGLILPAWHLMIRSARKEQVSGEQDWSNVEGRVASRSRTLCIDHSQATYPGESHSQRISSDGAP